MSDDAPNRKLVIWAIILAIGGLVSLQVYTANADNRCEKLERAFLSSADQVKSYYDMRTMVSLTDQQTASMANLTSDAETILRADHAELLEKCGERAAENARREASISLSLAP